MNPNFLHVDSDYSGQTELMPRLPLPSEGNMTTNFHHGDIRYSGQNELLIPRMRPIWTLEA